MKKNIAKSKQQKYFSEIQQQVERKKQRNVKGEMDAAELVWNS